jgi:predicted nucleic acid-binding protein
MFLVDTNVMSEKRKGSKADLGVVDSIKQAELTLFLPVQVIGELRQGIENLKHRGDLLQARGLETWFESMLQDFEPRILAFDLSCARIWGDLMAPNNQNPVDKQIAAIALAYDLTVVTRNTDDFAGTGVRLLNPFRANAARSAAIN